MGSDDLFHKRKAKTAKQLIRKRQQRALYDRVLIVCEGLKTEPNYFNELIDSLELNSANVEIDGSCDSSPINIIAYAKTRYAQERNTGDEFDKVYCVFDKDSHSSYTVALEKIKTLQPKNTFYAVNSVPCFEYWLLLHFEFSTKPYSPNENSSSCNNLIQDLKKYLPKYDKGDTTVYSQIFKSTPQAIEWSKRSLENAIINQTDNPSTLIHELVEYLINIKD